MAQNDRSRARPWANVPLSDGPWTPLVAIAAVIVAVALVAGGPRLGGDPPAVPDGQAYATADAAPDGAVAARSPAPSALVERDPAEPSSPDAPTSSSDPAASPSPSPRVRRRAPAAPHRQRRAATARPRASRGRRAVRPTPRTAAAPAVTTPTTTPGSAPGAPVAPTVRHPTAPHRTPPVTSADREFGL